MRDLAKESAGEPRRRGDGPPLPPSLGELTALALLGEPCCGHIALCDSLCRDALPPDAGGRQREPQ